MSKRLVLGVLFGALTLACSTMKTAVDYDHTVNWSAIHTFTLADGTKVRVGNLKGGTRR